MMSIARDNYKRNHNSAQINNEPSLRFSDQGHRPWTSQINEANLN